MDYRYIHLILVVILIGYIYSAYHIVSAEEKEIGSSIYRDHLHTPSGIDLYNNVWGATAKEIENKILKSYIYYKSNGKFGWEWNRPDPRPYHEFYVPPIFPEAVIGAIPTSEEYSTDIFPIKYKDVKSWDSEIKFQYIKKPTDKYNLAYDIYWMDGSTKKFNVMIWIQGQADGYSIGEATDGINTYSYYYKSPGSGVETWYWHGFVLKNQANVTSHKVNIKKLLDNAFKEGTINGDWEVHGIELGSEVWRGSGRIEIDKYIMTINGRSIDNFNKSNTSKKYLGVMLWFGIIIIISSIIIINILTRTRLKNR